MLKIESILDVPLAKPESLLKFRIKLPKVTLDSKEESAATCPETPIHPRLLDKRCRQDQKTCSPTLTGPWQKREMQPPPLPLFQAHCCKKRSPVRKGATQDPMKPRRKVLQSRQQNHSRLLSKNLSFAVQREDDSKGKLVKAYIGDLQRRHTARSVKRSRSTTYGLL